MTKPPTDVPSPTLLAHEAERYLQVSRATLSRLVRAGRIRCVRLSPGGKRIFQVAELDRFLNPANKPQP